MLNDYYLLIGLNRKEVKIINIKEFIEWCNLNQGFTNILVSFFTVIVSVVAVIISIITTRLPFKKKIMISGGASFGIGINFKGLIITVSNVGNRQVTIKKIGIKIGSFVYVNIKNDSKFLLKPTETVTHYFAEDDLTEIITLKNYKRVYAYAEDTESKRYKKNIGKVKDIKKFFL